MDKLFDEGVYKCSVGGHKTKNLHIYRSCIQLSIVPTDNVDLPMVNWFTICTDRTNGQGFAGLPYARAIMLTTSFTKGFCAFTDREFISPSVPTDNFTDKELVYHLYRPY